jgi:hypothetical protein
MKRAARNAAVLAAVAAGVLLAAGCGGPETCSQNPALGQAPSSCSLRPATEVTVAVRWCQCGSAARCDVTFDGNAFFLAPVADSCDVSCPDNPASCAFPTSSCTFTTPPLESNNTYTVTVADGFGVSSTYRTFTISGAGNVTCG